MIAKINLDGKEYMAIVFDESYSYEVMLHFRKAINSYMQTTESHLDSNGCDYVNHDENYYLHTLMNEMDLTEDQIFNMLDSYFPRHFERKEEKAKEKTCKIYI